MKKICTGILAHVDAGKTTLSEGLLYKTGSIRSMGRVDHKDTFLDTFELEKQRGITIFSKQAVMSWDEMEMTLLDTPGHVDFSAEMERTLQVLDCAILVISALDGVQGHTETLWRLLKRYDIPVFLFINKLDLPGADAGKVMQELQKRLSAECIDMTEKDTDILFENIAMCEESVLEDYMENGEISKQQIAKLVMERKLFPCFSGSALKLEGIDELLHGIEDYTIPSEYPAEFGARVYKIARDEQGNRLTYMKVTGGSLKVKSMLSKEHGKIDQIRIYSGAKYQTVDEVQAGQVCCVTGLVGTYPGEGLGMEEQSVLPVLEPVMTYQVILPEDCDVHTMLQHLRLLEEEEPQMHIVWNEKLQEIHIQLMGEVQIEIFKSIIWERFRVEVEFGTGSIVYKETIANKVEGVGHFEPLRHYAEVHLILEPGEPDSGLQFFTACKEDDLDRNWQRLILTHLEEREHPGVLTGSAITDMKITLVAGRAHLKHTEGGDFRQATYRAVRQGLMEAESVLLEPVYQYQLEVPLESVGRAMSDMQRMHGTVEGPEQQGDMSVLSGIVPVSTMSGYQAEVNAYTSGRGRLSCQLKGYRPCHNQEEVLTECTYDPEAELTEPTGSVFCAHGAGFYVPWYQVKDYMHLEAVLDSEPEVEADNFILTQENTETKRNTKTIHYSGTVEEDKELEAIFERTFGPIGRRLSSDTMGNLGEESRKKWKKKVAAPVRREIPERYLKAPKVSGEEYLLVDGYNIVFSWEELNDLSKVNLDSARGKLMDILCNYQGYRQCKVILVFDAYKVKGNPGSVMQYHNIHVVYTKEAETADMYIEKVTHEIGKKHRVTVATSDALEQLIVIGQGARRMSARELKEEIQKVSEEIQEEYLS